MFLRNIILGELKKSFGAFNRKHIRRKKKNSGIKDMTQPDEDDDEEEEEEDDGASSALQYKIFSLDTLYFVVCSKITKEDSIDNGLKPTWIIF